MHTYGIQIFQECTRLISDLKNEEVVTRLVDTFIRASPVLGAEIVLPLLPKIFEKVYCAEEYSLLTAMFLCSLASVLLSSHEVFTRVLVALAQAHNESETVTFGKILDVWLDKMRCVAQLEQRKLLGLALANLLTTRCGPFASFGLILLIVSEALNDVIKAEDNGTLIDSLVITEDHFDEERDGYHESDYDQRNKQLVLSDPVHTIIFKDYVQSRLCELRDHVGKEQFQQLLHCVDVDTQLRLKVYITF
ncbi:importin-11-like [Leptinotarsa decemlineata]|uniref:importin-11-like n=1 Tax=Leptinotarsa decemlineata TaxID=7539 RepID=UPI003D30414E